MKKLSYFAVLAGGLLAVHQVQAQGQGYVLDPAFGTGGKVLTSISATPNNTDVVLDAEVQPANKLLVLVSGTSGLAKLLYNVDGSLDTSYGTAGRLALAGSPAGFTPTPTGFYSTPTHDLLPDGRVLVNGSQSTVTNDALLLYAANGTLATGFGTNGVLPLGVSASSTTLQADGKVLVASSTPVTSSVGSITGGQMRISRLSPTGAVEFTNVLTHSLVAPASSIGSQPTVSNTTLTLQPDGKIIAVGTGTEHYSAKEFIVMARLLTDGTLDTSFGSAGTKAVSANLSTSSGTAIQTLRYGKDGVLLLPSGKFLLNTTVNEFTMAAFTSTGQVDIAYGNQGVGTITSAQSVINLGFSFLQPDGGVLAAGATASLQVARLGSQGVFDPTLAPTTGSPTYTYLRADFGGQASISDLDHLTKVVTLPTNEILVVGSSYRGTASSAHPAGSLVALAKFKPTSTLATAASAAAPEVRLYPNPLAGPELHLAGLTAAQAYTATLYNALGQAITSQSIRTGAGTPTDRLMLPELPAGVYRLRLTSGQWAASYAVTVQ